MNNANQQTSQIDHAGISALAYQKWQEAGCPDGQDMRFWLEAEAQLRSTAKAAMAGNSSGSSLSAMPKRSLSEPTADVSQAPPPPKHLHLAPSSRPDAKARRF